MIDEALNGLLNGRAEDAEGVQSIDRSVRYVNNIGQQFAEIKQLLNRLEEKVDDIRTGSDPNFLRAAEAAVAHTEALAKQDAEMLERMAKEIERLASENARLTRELTKLTKRTHKLA